MVEQSFFFVPKYKLAFVFCAILMAVASTSCASEPKANCPSTTPIAQTSENGNALTPREVGRISLAAVNSNETNRAEHITIRLDKNGDIGRISIHRKDYNRVPRAVRERVEIELPQSVFREYEVELFPNENDKIYTVEVRTTVGEICKTSTTFAGILRWTACRVEALQLPTAVRATAISNVPLGAIVTLEKPRNSSDNTYNVKMSDGAKVYRMRIREDGQLVEKRVRIPTWLEVETEQ